jgi:arsenite methyltransferase
MNSPIQQPTNDTIRNFVRDRYGAIAEQAGAPEPTVCGCRATGCCAGQDTADAATEAGYSAQLGYSASDLAAVPPGADLGLGCGNPLAIASIKAGETVLDLGSGAGFDVFLAARQLAGTGRVLGVDMTPAMITKARRNAEKAGWPNVEFRLGEIEALPVADGTVDLVISNCVVNLSPEKPRVFAEAFRVLKPGGRLAISDVVATKPLPDDLRARLPMIGACIGGASLVEEVRAMLVAAGFSRVDIDLQGASRKFISQWGPDVRIADYLVSAIITAWKS